MVTGRSRSPARWDYGSSRAVPELYRLTVLLEDDLAMNRRTRLLLGLLLGSACAATAQVDSLPLMGRIKPRAARDISSSRWSVGGETLDRGFGVYANYKAYLGTLGAKSIRLQAGWARCEPRPGAYDWGWLDAIVDDALAQGVQPWLQLSYGNPVYPGGGDTGLGGGFPDSPDALAAWDRWVRAIVQHYGDRVHQWEVWNEPDLNEKGTATVEAYLELYLRTAAIIREVQPKGKSRIYALALCYDLEYAERFLAGMTQRRKLDLIDAVTIHTYPENPDDTRNIDELRALIARTGRPIPVRQGETGAPSKYQKSFALKGMPWTETMQAKWDLRRMLAHHAKDVPLSLFTMIDLHYRRDGAVDMNYKGLLASREDQTVDHVKPAYEAAQRVFAIFDDTLERVAEFSCVSSATRSLAASAYANKKTGAQVVALWFRDDKPSDSNARTPVDLTFSGARFDEPVHVDLLTGEVRALPRPKAGSGFSQIPLYDSPILIAEKSALPIDRTAAR